MARLTPPALCALAWLAAACSQSGEDHPPPLSTVVLPPLPVACSALVDAGFALEQTTLIFDAGVAACPDEGMSCPLAQDPESLATAGCTREQQVLARCRGIAPDLRWQLECWGAAGAGGSGAVGAGAGGAGSGA